MVLAIAVSGCALFDAADEEVIQIDRSHDRQKAEMLNARGVHWLEHGEVASAQRDFEKALLADETYGPAHNNLGQIYYDAGDMYQAAIAFDTAAQYMQGDPIAFNNLGLALESGGKLMEALENYQRAYEIDPTEEEFLGNLVRARIRLGEWDESVVVQLRELRFIETRPEWIGWIDELLAIRFNPFLDRGPGGPDLTPFNGSDGGEAAPASDEPPTPEDVFPPPDPEEGGFPGPSSTFLAPPPESSEDPTREAGRATLE